MSAGPAWPSIAAGSPPGRCGMRCRMASGTRRALRRSRVHVRAGPAAVTAVLDTVRRSGDLVVCDVPRSRGPAAEAMVAAADLAVLVVPARVRAALAAGRVAGWVADQNTNQGIVVRGPAPGGLRGRDVAEVVGLPLIATMRAQPGLAAALERGGLRLGRRSPLVHAAESVLDVLAGPEPGSRWAA